MQKHNQDRVRKASRREARHQGGQTNTCVIRIEVQPICSSQYAEARSN